MSNLDAFPVSRDVLDADRDRDCKPVPSKPAQLGQEGLADLALPSTRASRKAPGLSGESLARMHRDFAMRGDRRRSDRARQQRRSFRRLT
jgi:hypothetical protein